MFTWEEIKIGICWWAIFGFFYIAIAQPNVSDKKKAFWNAVASGPICWVILAAFAFKYYLEGVFNATS